MSREANGSRITNDEHFIKHLEQASQLVKSWPSWKQTILGTNDNAEPAKRACSSIKVSPEKKSQL